MIETSLRDAWYILGVRGSGKTKFAKRLTRELRTLYPAARLYVLDSKGGGDFAGWPGVVEDQEPPAPLARPGDVQVWRPPYDDWAGYAEWLGRILKARQPAVVLIDELSSLARGNSVTSYPVQLGQLLKQGRTLDIAPVVLSQEGTAIPRQVKNQAAHFVYFRLGADDAHGIAQACTLLGRPAPRRGENPAPRGRFGFWHRVLLPAPGPAIEYRDLQEFFG